LRRPVTVSRDIRSLGRMNDDRTDLEVFQQCRDLVFGDCDAEPPLVWLLGVVFKRNRPFGRRFPRPGNTGSLRRRGSSPFAGHPVGAEGPALPGHGGVSPRRAPHGELAAGLGCRDELSLPPVPCCGSHCPHPALRQPLLSIHPKIAALVRRGDRRLLHRQGRQRAGACHLLNVAIFIRAGAGGQIARLAENPNARHKRITRPLDRVRRHTAQEAVFGRVGQPRGRCVAHVQMTKAAMPCEVTALGLISRQGRLRTEREYNCCECKP
jgi:hypothetical protein